MNEQHQQEEHPVDILATLMREIGYERFPAHTIDIEVAKNTPCEECGGECEAIGFRRIRLGTCCYVVYSLCKKCGDAVEF